MVDKIKVDNAKPDTIMRLINKVVGHGIQPIIARVKNTGEVWIITPYIIVIADERALPRDADFEGYLILERGDADETR